MATPISQAGPSQHSQTPEGIFGRSTLRTRTGGPENGSDDEDEGVSEEEIVYATNKGKGIVPPPSPRPSMQGSRNTRPRERSGMSWADLDLSIIVACVSPIGNWLTGGDHIKNLFLIILLIFYLHQLIEVPWKLYQASRPRKSSGLCSGQPERVTKLAATELKRQELVLLLVTAVSPFLGATFLRHVLSALGETESLSWFSTTLFVLATGIRPWTHLVSRVQGRTEALHDAIHCPSDESVAEDVSANTVIIDRLGALERELHTLRARTLLADRLQEVCDDLSEAVGDLERDGKRSERKADAARLVLASRLAALEKGLVQVEQNRRMDVDALRRGHVPPLFERVYLCAWGCLRTLVVGPLRLLKMMWALGAPESTWNGQGSSSTIPSPTRGIPRSSNGAAHPRISSNGAPDARLPTIPESALSDGEGEVEGEDDADSDGTYVSEKNLTGAAHINDKTHRVRGKSGSRSRSRSHSGSTVPRKRAGQATPVSFHRWSFECAQAVVLWPYRASVRILTMLVPPLGNILPKAAV